MAKTQEKLFLIKKLLWPLTRSVLSYAHNFQVPATQATFIRATSMPRVFTDHAFQIGIITPFDSLAVYPQ